MKRKGLMKRIIVLVNFIMFFYICYFCVYADDVPPGTIINLPDLKTHPQLSLGNIELEIDSFNWAWDPRKLYDIWRGMGKPTDENDLCYIPVAGVNWIFVAVAGSYGNDGDYLKVHVEKSGQARDYYMMKFDEKSRHDPNAYKVDNVHYGHGTYENGKYVLDVLEFPYHGSSGTSLKFRREVMPVLWIQNGGSYFEHPEGPIGFTITPDVKYDSDPESGTLLGAVGQFLRNGWNALGTFLDNHLENKNKSTVLFDLTDGFLNDLVWPLPGHTKVGSPFGKRKSPTGGGSHFHTGIDIGASAGTIEVAAGTGLVDTAGYFTPGSGYQSYLYLDDKDTFGGQVIFGYLHTSEDPIVKAGTHVYAGQPISKVGPKEVYRNGKWVRNGSTTGSHLHFSMRIDGEHVDPEIYFPEEMRK